MSCGMSCDVGEATEGLEYELWHRWSDESSTHSPSFQSLHLRDSSFSNPSVALPTSAHSPTLPSLYQLILQPFRRFTYVTTHSPTLLLLDLRHSSFTNPSVALPTSQLILQPFRCFTYVTSHSTTLLSLYLSHSSSSNRSVASPTLQLILQPFFRFSYVTGSSLRLCHNLKCGLLYV